MTLQSDDVTVKTINTSVHTYPDTQRIQKFPLRRAYTEISGYTERIRRTRVDARCIRIKKLADTKISGYVWTGPQSLWRLFLHTYFVKCRQTLLNLNSKGPYPSSEREIKFLRGALAAGREKEGEPEPTSRISRCEMLIGGDDISN